MENLKCTVMFVLTMATLVLGIFAVVWIPLSLVVLLINQIK